MRNPVMIRIPLTDGGYPIDSDLSQMTDDGCPLTPDPARWTDAEYCDTEVDPVQFEPPTAPLRPARRR